MMKEGNERETTTEFRCCCGLLRTVTAMKICLAYFTIWSILLSQLPMPRAALFFGLFCLSMCVLAAVGMAIRNTIILLIFYLTILLSIIFLFYLDGYFFFVTIFYKDEVKDAFGYWITDLTMVSHITDIFLILFHYYLLGVISKYRRYQRFLKEGEKTDVEAPRLSRVDI